MPAPSSREQEWREQLPSAVARCAERWGLSVGEPLSGGLVGHVLSCTTSAGEAAVLKLNPPRSDEFAGTPEQEAAALRAWAGSGAVELLAFAGDLRALLTSRALPGTPLPAGNERDAIQAVADVLSRLVEGAIPPIPFLPLADAVDRHLLRRLAVSGDARDMLEPLIEKARASAEALAASAQHEVLLHGDVMDKNLLRHRDRFLAIDPMPHVGDPHSDIGFWAATRSPATDLDTRAVELARLLDRNPDRASRWAAVYAVGSACETWRPDSLELREWVQSARANELLSV
jgi:streptomycin 6-kinase